MKITNKYNLPKPILNSVSREYTYTPKRYSVTSILKPIREMLLLRRHGDEILSDVADMTWLIFGNAIHEFMEKNAKGEAELLPEEKMTMTTSNGYTLSGVIDLFYPNEGKIVDYKTATVWKFVFGDFQDYIDQTLLYCLIAQKNGYKANKGELTAILKDWKKNEALKSSDYPQYPMARWHSQEFSQKEIDEAEKKINDKFIEIEKCESMEDDELPLCDEKERAFGKKDTYAVMKVGNKRAIRVFDSLDEANNFSKTDIKYYVEARKAEEQKCKLYCSVCGFCNHYKNNYASSILTTPKGNKIGFRDVFKAKEYNKYFFEGKALIEEKETIEKGE